VAEEKKERLWSSLRRGWWPLFAPSSSPSPSPQSAFFILAESFSKPRTRSRSTKHCRRLKKVFFFSSFFFFSFFSFLFFSFHHPCFDKIQIRVHDLSLHCLRAHAFGLHFPPFDGYSKRHYQNLRSAGLHAPHASV